MGRTNGQVYYEFADLCAARACARPLSKDAAAAPDAIGKRAEAISNLIIDFATQAGTFIVAVLMNAGWQRDVVGP